MNLLSLLEQAKIKFSREIVPGELDISGMAYHSQRVEPGNLFVAITGLEQDGMKFVLDAVQHGAVAVMGEGRGNFPVPFVSVPDARRALADISAAFFDFPSRKLELIGITGTNGKTTTSYLLESILKMDGRIVGVIGTTGARVGITSFPTHLTTPESYDLQKILWQMQSLGVQSVVMEVSSHALQLERVRGCEFTGGIFTNLTHDHLDFHGNMENYFLAKERLFTEHVSWSRPNAFATINGDDPYGRRLAENIPERQLVVYSKEKEGAPISGKILKTDVAGMLVELQFPEKSRQIQTPLLGEMNLENILAAASAAVALHVPPDVIARGLLNVREIPGRFERIQIGQPFEVIVDFAHTPDGLEKLLRTVRGIARGRVLLLFGCPGNRDRDKRPIMADIASRLADYTFVTTDDPHTEPVEKIIGDVVRGFHGKTDVYRAIIDRSEAIREILHSAQPNDWVILAGRGHETFQDFQGEKITLDDRVVARKILSERYNSSVVKSA